MSPSEKRRFIKDPVWGQVEFFPWERVLFRHELVNRLHGIVQTSCTFKVYPALRYSRFSHSIGALHVVTQMFVNIARNLHVVASCGDTDDAKRGAKEAGVQLDREIDLVEQQFKACDASTLNSVRAVLSRSFAVEPANALALAVVRLGALLHDCGHLPYSHLFEHTLEAFLAYTEGRKTLKRKGHGGDTQPPDAVDYEIQLAARPASSGANPPNTAKLRDALRIAHFRGRQKHPNLPKFHELLGYQFATLIAHSLDEVDEKSPMRQFVRVCVETARDVWARELRGAAGEDGGTPILSSLLSGHVDADRIDFVHRDSYFSGLFRCSVDSRRLFDLYEAGQDEKRGWLARPSCRSASDAGKLLIERYQLYKYVVAHHRVHLFDELLERCILTLLIEGRLDPFLDALTMLLAADFSGGHSSREIWQHQQLRRRLLHIDDSWIDVQVRDRYADFDTPNSPASTAATYFEAFLESRGRLRSVFKWDREFDKWWNEDVANWFRKKVKKRWPRLKAAVADDYFERFRWDLVSLLPRKRHQLEMHLTTSLDGGRAVLVGITGNKVQAHIKDVREAAFFGLTTVNDYLTQLTRETMVFNLWFQARAIDADVETDAKKLLAAVLAWLESNVLGDFLEARPSQTKTSTPHRRSR